MMLWSILLALVRNLLRLLKLRNLLLIVFVLFVLYTFKNIKEIYKTSTSIQQPQQESIHQPMSEVQFIINHNAETAPNLVSASKKNGNTNEHLRITSTMLPIGKKIDWHNYTQIYYEESRTGIGEQGKPAYLPEEKKSDEKYLFSVNGFNAALSDLIPLNRSIPDIRHPGCRKKTYIESLPTVSVVVPFHNEHWSTLLRTAFSVLYRSPKKLIKEIILVDDASTKDFLGYKLNDYIDKNMPKVKIKRIAARSGLITARLLGAKEATGDVLVFLDSHTEVNVNWLPPLLEPIALDYRTVVCPFIDVVAYDTFEYRAQDEGARGAFDWEFFYKRLPLLPKDEANMPEPFENPIMAGGLFAISRKWFWELGGYDPQLDIWGGEQYELSFKIWQCGGRMLDAPCSRVGHIYRKFGPFADPGHGDFVGRNYKRVAEVWMDEYAKYLYQRRPYYSKIIAGNLTEQHEIRRRLHCKPFKWFMTQIAFDLPSNYPMVEPPPYASGKIRSNLRGLCVAAIIREQTGYLEISSCRGVMGTEWMLSWRKDIRLTDRNLCWDVPDSSNYSPVKVLNCHGGGGNQLWRYDHDLKQLRHKSGVCLDWDPDKNTVFVNQCLVSACDRFHEPHSQQWIIDSVDFERLEDFDSLKVQVTGPLPYEEPPNNGSTFSP